MIEYAFLYPQFMTKSKTYYGEYSLEQWIQLLLSKEIVLPSYQRSFVWSVEQVKRLIRSLHNGLFVPPITIGRFQEKDEEAGCKNYILDGQQRLSSLLIAYIGFFPKKDAHRPNPEEGFSFANDNDDIDGDEDADDDDHVQAWTFEKFTKLGRNRQSILDALDKQTYIDLSRDSENIKITPEFLRSTYIGFSYIVPSNTPIDEQLKFYSSIFRNINIGGMALSPLESRKSLYFLKNGFDERFDPPFLKSIRINNGGVDFVRYLSLLSQYKKSKGDTRKIAQTYKTKMEVYYESYIYSEVHKENDTMFTNILGESDIATRYEHLKASIKELGIPIFTSIIKADLYFFGLIYYILFDGKKISLNAENKTALTNTINNLEVNDSHAKSPSALKYLRERIAQSIEIYRKFVQPWGISRSS